VNSKERMLKALNHEEADRVPLDLGGTLVSSINYKTYQGLLSLLGINHGRDVQFLDIVQQIAVMDEDVLQKLGVDVRGVLVRAPSNWQFDLHEDENDSYFEDQWGIGWRMPKETGLYYDLYRHPLPGSDPADIDRYPWPDPRDPARWEGMVDEAKALHDAEEYFVVLGSTGLTAGLLQTSQWLQGYVDHFTNLAGSPAFMHRLLEKLMELDIGFWDSFLPVVGPYLDMVMYADDFAGQNGMLMSMKMYREYFKDRYRQIFAVIRERAPHVKLFFHSCGAIYDFIPELIDLGVDIVNPVQVSAAGMDTKQLKSEYGKDLVFWGGGVDTQRVLPRGTAQEVRDEVKRRIDDLAPGGGFVFNTVHNIQGDVPPENVMAMHEAFLEYGAY
jgi:uroporphyrinogen decarboxylase